MAAPPARRAWTGPGVALVLGAAAIGAAIAAGRTDLLAVLLEPPAPVSWMLGSVVAVAGVWLLLRSSEQVGSSREATQLVRAIRLVFLAVAAFAASAGWFIGSPVPIVAALVIAGVDVLETTFFLMVAQARR